MPTRFWIILLPCLLVLQNYLSAQSKLNIKFGKISAADFDLTKNVYDTGAAAVVIADIGSTSFEGNNKGYFTLVFNRYRRVKILNKNGFDVASGEVEVYSDGVDEEKLSDLKAVTYNLENGQVIQTKLDDKSLFTEKVSKKTSIKKFTLPAVKVGSIIEISYTVKSDFYTFLRSWEFQGIYPCLWSEYKVTIPQFFHYMKVLQGDRNFYIDTITNDKAYYNLRESGGATAQDDIYHITTDVVEERWVKKDVPAMEKEPYITTLDNYVSKVIFQLHYVQYSENSERHDYMGSWFIATDKLLKDEQFGKALDADNNWMGEELKSITAGSTSDLEKTEKIYNYLRAHFTCTSHDALWAQSSLKTVFKNQHGNVAEINLLLTAMLRHENIPADPVILSTRDNGYASETYPLIEQFNYVICAATIDQKPYYLDATHPELGFGHLPVLCYNGGARTINRDKPYLVYFNPDSLKERKITSVLIINDDKGYPSGTYQSTLGYNQSYKLREDMEKQSTIDYFKATQASFGSDLELDDPQGIDSLTRLEDPVKIYFDFNLKNLKGEDVVYFNPMVFEKSKDNPFSAADRTFPVEIPYLIDETYIFNMDIPTGYVVDELPQSARVALNGTDGTFEYLIQKSESSIQMRCHLALNKAVFAPIEYNTLRDFYAYVVKKQSEQIVFKKKK